MQVDNVDLDSSLEFNDFDMGFPDLSDDRTPVSKPGKAFVKGLGKGLSDKSLISDLMKKNLPREYGSTFDMLDEVATGARNFSADMVKESKPIIGNLANAADKFLPSSFKSTKEKLSRVRDWAEKEDSYGSISKDERRKQGTGIELGRIFEQQQQTQAINDKISKKEKDFDRGLGMAQHKDILTVLTRLSNNTERVAGYTTTINSAWQRKSLETQFHQLFVLQDILEESKKSNAEVISNLTSIVKNSALPEYRKTQKDEAFLDEARRRFSGKIVDASHNFFKRGLSKMRSDVSAFVGDIASVSSMLSTAGDLNALQNEFDPTTMKDKLSGFAGNKVGKWALSKVGGHLIKSAKKNPKYVDKIAKGQNFLKSFQMDGSGLAKEYLDRKDKDGSGLMSMIAGYLNNTFEHQKPNYNLATYDAKNMYGASPFTNKVAYSITDVIPGYLSRILQEQTAMRTGGQAERIVFDYRSGKFDTSKNIIDSIKKSISSDELSKSSSGHFNDIMSKIEETTDLSDKERSEIAKVLLKKGSDESSIDPEKMTSEDHWKDLVSDPKTAAKMSQFMENLFGTKSNKEFYGFNNDPQKKAEANQWIEQVKNLKHLRKDKYNDAQFLVDNGMMEHAQKAGLVDKDGRYNSDLIDHNTTQLKGSFKGKGSTGVDVLKEIRESKTDLGGHDEGVVEGAYQLGKRALRLESAEEREKRLGTSDINVKDHIKKPGNVLGPISRLPIKEWQYKPGHEDGGKTKNIGPMAQDLNRQFGEEVAPTGKKIDLVNANGIAFKAIQELNSKFDKFKDYFKKTSPKVVSEEKDAPSSALPQNVLSCLRGIYYNTGKMVEQGLVNINLSTEGIKNMAAALGQQLGKVDLSGAGDKAKAAYDKASTFVKENSASSVLGKIGDFISNTGGDTVKNGLQRGKSILSSSFSGAKNIMNSVRETAGSMFDHVKMRALETFDVYMPGEKEPRMIAVKMRQGYYIDFKKQTPVKTRKDVREATEGITEVQTDGSMEMILQGSELPDAIFINTHKSAIEKVIQGGANTVKSVFNNILKPGFINAQTLMKGAKALVLKTLDAPIDIYLKKDPSKCVLLARVMREGGYRDHQDGTIITRPGQIKGAVFDIAKNEIAVSLDDFRDGLVDINGKSITFSALRTVAGAVIGAGASIMRSTMDKLSKAPGILGKLAKKGTDMMKSLASKLGIPSFTLGNFFGTEAVDILKDIKSILMYQAGLGAAPVIGGVKSAVKSAVSKATTSVSGKFKQAVTPSLESGASIIAPPKENVNAVDPDKPVSTTEAKTESSGIGSMLMKGVGGAASLLGSFFKKKKEPAGAGSSTEDSEDKLKSVEETNKRENERENKISKLSKTLKGFKDKLSEKKDKTVDALKRARTIAKDGISRTADGLKVGSWQERAKNAININKEVARDKADVKVYATKNIFTMIADMTKTVSKKLRDWFSKSGDPAQTAGDIADAAGGNGKSKPGGGGKWGKMAKFAGRFATGAGAAYLGSGAIDNAQEGNYGKAALEGAGAAALAAHSYGGMTAVKALGKGAMKIGGKFLGPAGLAYGAYSAYDNVKKGNYGEAAVDAGLTVAGGALMYGGAGALGITAGSIGTGLLAAGGTALAILTSPVTLTALAVAGAAAVVGYGGYKAYKYLTSKDFNPTELMRFLEYGLRGGDTGNQRTIYELEQYLEEVSTTKQDSWEIDDKKFDLKKAMSIFDIDEKDQKRASDFNLWFEGRFKQIFGKWKLLIKSVGDTDKISWLEKASDAKLLEVYKGFKPHYTAYSISSSPFSDIELNTDSSVIDNYKLEWSKGIIDSSKKNKDKATEKGAVEAAVEAAKKELADKKAGDKTPGSEALPESKPVVPSTDFDSKLKSAADSYKARLSPQDIIKSGTAAGALAALPTTAQAVGVDEPEDKSVGDKASPGTPLPKTSSPGAVSSLPGAGGDLLTGSGADKFLTMGKDVNINGLHPSMKRLFLGMVEEYGQLTGKKIQVNRAYSSTEEQAALYKANPNKAAKPGTSLHEFGLAIDAQSSDLNAMEKLGLMKKYGFTRPIGGEPWHMEAAGIFDNGVRQKAKRDQSFAEAYIESSVGHGGGGLGARGRSDEIKRDDMYAKMLFSAGTTPVDIVKKDEAPGAPAKVAANDSGKGSPGSPAIGKAGAPDATGVTDKESKGGKIPSSVGSGNASKDSFDKTVKAANDSTMQDSKDIAQGTSKGGAYQSLPDSKGDGWENNKDMILASAKLVGIDPALAAAIAAKESSLRPGAQGVNSASGNSTAQGLFQFMPDTWKEMVAKYGAKYGIAPGTSPMDARANVVLGMEYLKSSMNKGDGSPQEAYMGHMLGATGLERLKSLKDDEVAAKSFQSQAANNPKVFYDGGDASRPFTKQQLLTKVSDSLNKNLQDFNIPLTIKNSVSANGSFADKLKAVEKSYNAKFSPQDVIKNSAPVGTTEVSFTAPEVEESSKQQNSMVALTNQAPVITSARTAPVLDNTNNGTARMEKIGGDQLQEQKLTNSILVDIKDLLAKSLNMGTEAKPAEAIEPVVRKTEPTTAAANQSREPTPLPQSYVQRRRVA